MDRLAVFFDAGNVFADAQLLHKGEHRVWGRPGSIGYRNLYGNGYLHSGLGSRTDDFSCLRDGLIGFQESGRKNQDAFCSISFRWTGGDIYCSKRDLKRKRLET